MEAKWHQIGLACPQCGREIRIICIRASADGMLLIEILCDSCDESFYWRDTFVSLAAMAHAADIQESEQVQPATPEEVEDLKFLHELRITMPEDST